MFHFEKRSSVPRCFYASRKQARKIKGDYRYPCQVAESHLSTETFSSLREVKINFQSIIPDGTWLSSMKNFSHQLSLFRQLTHPCMNVLLHALFYMVRIQMCVKVTILSVCANVFVDAANVCNTLQKVPIRRIQRSVLRPVLTFN